MPKGHVVTSEAQTPQRPLARGGSRWAALAIFLAVAAAAGLVGNLLQGSDVGARYLALERPAWAPPQQAFGIVWPALYVLIGVAGWRLWTNPSEGRLVGIALGAWAAQLVLNALWPGMFFGLEAFVAAAALIVVLDLVVVLAVVSAARVDRWAAALLVPYLVWLLYATALNIAIARLN